MSDYGRDATKEHFVNVKVFGRNMIFNDMRLDPDTIPSDLYVYEVRDDDCNGKPCEVCKYVMVNFLGTLISKEPISTPKWIRYLNYYDWDPEDWEWGDWYTSVTLADYIAEESHCDSTEE